MAHKTKLHEVKPINDGVEVVGASSPYYPRIHFKESDFPEAKGHDVSDEKYLLLKVNVKEKREIAGDEIQTEYEILEIGDATEEYK